MPRNMMCKILMSCPGMCGLHSGLELVLFFEGVSGCEGEDVV